MMIPPEVFYLTLTIGVPVLGLLIERLVRLHLSKRLAPKAVLKAASHVVFCGTLWAFVFLYRYFYPGPDWVANLAFLLLAIVWPIFSVLHLIALAKMRLAHPAKRPVALLCGLNLAGVAAMWMLINQRLMLW